MLILSPIWNTCHHLLVNVKFFLDLIYFLVSNIRNLFKTNMLNFIGFTQILQYSYFKCLNVTVAVVKHVLLIILDTKFIFNLKVWYVNSQWSVLQTRAAIIKGKCIKDHNEYNVESFFLWKHEIKYFKPLEVNSVY